jgi:hypothetical protein
MWVFETALTYNLGWHTRDDSKWFDVFSHDGAGRNDCAVTDCDT